MTFVITNLIVTGILWLAAFGASTRIWPEEPIDGYRDGSIHSTKKTR